MSQTPNVGLPYIAPSQAGKEVVHAEGLNRLDALLRGAVLTISSSTPPASPADGDAHIVGSSPTGAWAGQAGNIAAWYGGWIFIPARLGMEVWNAGDSTRRRFNGTAWVVAGGTPAAGWAAPTGTLTRGALDADAADLPTTRQTLAALIADLRARGVLA